MVTHEGEKLVVGNSMAFEISGLALRTFGPAPNVVDTVTAIGDVGPTRTDAGVEECEVEFKIGGA
jgi:hypothetical protein